MTLEPGKTIAHYRLVRLIGQGGMGAVYLAEDTKLDRPVALKILPPEMAASPDRLERFRREAKAVAALNHPHIVTIFSVEEESGTHFLTMELVEGESLDKGIPAGGLPLAKVFDIGIALADALAAAHEKGIIHRDLKPANVIVTRDSRVKVLDFGLAKLAQEASGPEPSVGNVSEEATSAPAAAARAKRDDSLTAAGMVMGTVPYMSPEQVGGEAVDARTDIFSLGVVLYELATGRRPFEGKNKAETISSILRDAPRPVSEARQEAPRELARIVEHCLQKDPESRFQTAKDVRNELRVLRKEVESGATAASAPSVPRAGSATAPAHPPGHAPASTSSGPAVSAGPSRRWLWAAGGAVIVLAVVASFWMGRRGGEGNPAGPTAAGDSAPGHAPLAAPVPETNSLAVLPFANMSADKDQDYFSDGLTEELLNALVRIPQLKVTGRTSSFSFKGKNEDLRTIGEKLGVANLLEGSVRKSGNKVRITAQLVKAADGFHLWSETYDRTLDDIFAVQDDIAKSVAQALQVTLLGSGDTAKNPNAEAYDLILRARFVMQSNTEANVLRGRELLKQALDLSPDYAPAWAEMGLTHARDYERATTVADRQRALGEAQKALSKALALDPHLGVAHSRMANTQMLRWEFADAERSAEKGLATDPRSPLLLGNVGTVFSRLGRYQEARSILDRSIAADPLNPIPLYNKANLSVVVGRLDEAESLARRILELKPDDPNAHSVLGTAQLLLGQVEEARRNLTRFAELTGQGEYGRLLNEAFLEHAAGHEPASKAAADEFEKRFGASDPLACADMRAFRGETDASFARLERALAARDPALAEIRIDPFMRSLHADPRWNALLKKIGLPTE